jgi:hypothetical protein
MHRTGHAKAIRSRFTAWLVLVAISVQVFSGTLAWCLHGDEPAHLEAAVAPCDQAAPANHQHCPDHNDHLMIDVAQATASSGASSMDHAFTPALVWYFPRHLSGLDTPPRKLSAESLRPPLGEPPRIANARVGFSARLLV